MTGKNQANPVEIVQDELDEGWWAAVLADEESSIGEYSEVIPVSNHPSELMLVDWDRVKSIYENDEIIPCRSMVTIAAVCWYKTREFRVLSRSLT